MAFIEPQAFFFFDAETTSLPHNNDYSSVHMLEVGAIITDFDLNVISAYEEVIKLTQPGLEVLRNNPEVVSMHTKNGLIRDSRNATMTVADVEKELIALIKETTTFKRGEFMFNGSGNAAYDLPLIRTWMPEFASYMAYYPADVGIFRRMTKIFNHGRPVVNYSPKSYGDEKLHRAMADVKAHLDEERQFRDWVQSKES